MVSLLSKDSNIFNIWQVSDQTTNPLINDDGHFPFVNGSALFQVESFMNVGNLTHSWLISNWKDKG